MNSNYERIGISIFLLLLLADERLGKTLQLVLLLDLGDELVDLRGVGVLHDEGVEVAALVLPPAVVLHHLLVLVDLLLALRVVPDQEGPPVVFVRVFEEPSFLRFFNELLLLYLGEGFLLVLGH